MNLMPASLAAIWARTMPASVLRSVTAMAVETERLRRRHQLLGMGAAGEKREIGGDLELGVAGHGEKSPEDAMQIPGRRPELAS